MLNIVYNGGFESLKNKFNVNLPNFTILTGLNGAGKTHFLQGIELGKIEVFEDSNPINSFVANESKYISYKTLKTYDSEPSTIETSKKKMDAVWKAVLRAKSKKNDHFSFLAILEIESGLRDIVQYIIKKSGLDIWELNENDIIKYYPTDDLKRNEIFHGDISNTFKRYYDRMEENMYKEFRSERYRLNEQFLTEKEFSEMYGKKPWDTINIFLKYADFNYKINSPEGNSRDSGFEAKLINIKTEEEISFSSLSSGEQTMVALVLALYNTNAGLKFPKLLLLDEPDAFLHPSLIKKFLNIINEFFVKEMNLRVIMTTHSVSTVALCQEESLHVIEKEDRTVKKVTKEKALRVLTEGVPSISISYENRKQVFVESDNDILYFEKFYEMLKNRGLNQEISLSFIAAGTEKNGGCDQVKKLVEALNKNGNNKVFGIIDWDMKNEPSGNIKVLGYRTRYTIENYIFDPILIAAFLLREKLIEREALNVDEDENFNDFKKFSEEKLQKIADSVIEKMRETLNILTDERTEVSYFKGIKLKIPTEYLSYKGHDLEEHYKKVFPSLNEFKGQNKKKDLKLKILSTVIDEMPEFIPKDIFELFIGIQES